MSDKKTLEELAAEDARRSSARNAQKRSTQQKKGKY